MYQFNHALRSGSFASSPSITKRTRRVLFWFSVSTRAAPLRDRSRSFNLGLSSLPRAAFADRGLTGLVGSEADAIERLPLSVGIHSIDHV